MSDPPNNNPPDPNDPATFTGNSGVAATPTVPTPTTTNTGATGNLGGWYIWTTAPNPAVATPLNPAPITQWIISGSTDPEPAIKNPEQQQKVKRGNEEGYECQNCKVFNAYADLNTPENNPTHYLCYSCRKGMNG